MRQLIGLAILVLAAKGASAQILPYGYQSPRSASPAAVQSGPSERIHPAVVRVIATGGVGTASLGSGALVAVTEQHGLVVTNWHVVRDAVGPIYVAFADGFRSGATVLRTDRNWDLAALAIWRPNVAPILLANEAPRPGEVLTIAGYGGGQYRTMTGQCTQYVAPGRNQPFEMVELSVPARQGDSGGPILNGRGELAGVLFGTTGTTTTGSYCGRVRWFLNPVIDDFHGMQPSAIQIAQQRGGAVMPVEQGRSSQSAAGRGVVDPFLTVRQPQPSDLRAAGGPIPGGALAATHGVAGGTAAGRAIMPPQVAATPGGVGGPGWPPQTPQVAVPSPYVAGAAPAAAIAAPNAGVAPISEEISLWEFLRNGLAMAGAILIFFHAVRVLTIPHVRAEADDEDDEDDEDDDD